MAAGMTVMHSTSLYSYPADRTDRTNSRRFNNSQIQRHIHGPSINLVGRHIEFGDFLQSLTHVYFFLLQILRYQTPDPG